MLRRISIAVIFSLGVIGSVATSPATADISGVSEAVRVVLDANEPSRDVLASAIISADGLIADGTGQIGLAIELDGDAEGSLAVTLTSDTTCESQATDIVDTQAQGSARIGINAFDGCGEGCTEELTLTFERTDAELAGTLGLTFTLDGLASTDGEEAGTGSITFSIDN